MGTNINELIEDISNNKLSSEENSMVDSIINDLPDPVWPVIIFRALLKSIDVSSITAKFLI